MSIPGSSGYAGVAFHPEFEGGTTRGRIVVGHGTVRFESETGQPVVELPLRGLGAKRGGATGEHLYLTHPSFPDWTLTTSDPAILKDPVLLAEGGIGRQVRSVRRTHHLLLIGCLGLILLLVAVIVALVSMKEAMVTTVARQVPPEWEAKLGETAFAQVKLAMPLIEDPQLIREFEQMAQPLLASIPDKRWQYKIHLARAGEPNAFALPGGIIVVNSGLILQAERPEEVFGVLAHEIAHVTMQHGTRQIVSRAGLWLLIQASVGDVHGMLGYLVDSSAYLLTQSYSRNYEREADETGWQYLLNARLDPSGMLDFFRRMKQLEEKGNVATMPAILSTHPATDERIEWLEQKRQKGRPKEAFQSSPVDFKAFKERLQSVAGKS